MINKLKIGFLIAMFAFLGIAGSASAAAVSYTADSTVTIDGSDYTILSGSGADSVIVSGTTLIVDPDATLTFTLVSPDGYDLNPDPETSMTCDEEVSTVVVAAAAATVTFTPNNDVIACESTSGGGGSSHGSSSHSGGGGGGGGGSSSSSSDTPATPGSVPVSCAPGQMFSALTGERCTATSVVFCATGEMFSPTTGERCNTYLPVTGGGSTISPAGGYAFGTGLIRQGSKGEACKAWQMFFNNKAQAGLVVDGNCGPKTIAAARAWQSVSGLVADGILGAMSRAKANMQ